MPDCVGDGPEAVVVGTDAVVVVVVVGVWPMMLTQTYVLAHMPLQLLPTLGFQVTNWVVEILYRAAIVSHISPAPTRWKASQLSTMPGWMGSGVSMPFGRVVGSGAEVVVLVVVVPGLWPITPTHM
jgi:hypothetical protein